MAIPFATFKPDYSPQGVLAGILQAQQNNQQGQAQDILSAINQQKLAALPEQQRAQLNYQQAMTGAIPSEIALREAQANRANNPQADLTKNPLVLSDYGQKLFKNNPNDPKLQIVANMIHNLTTGKKGVSVSTSPTGGTQVSVGGSAESPGYYDETIVNPNITGSRGGGATFTDTNTGQVYSAPTNTYKGVTQQRIVADKQLKNKVENLGDWLKESDYFNPATHAASYLSYGLKGIVPGLAGISSKLRLAQGGITTTADKFFQQSGVPKTKEAFSQVYHILQPTLNESYNTWMDRTKKQLAAIMMNNEENKKSLSEGINVGGNNQPFKFVRHAPKSFFDILYPKFDHVINPEYSAKQSSNKQGNIDPKMADWIARAKKIPANKDFTDAQLISFYKNKKGANNGFC